MGHNTFPDGSDKRICLQCRRCRRHEFNPWARKIPKGGNSNALQYSCLENPMDSGAWQVIVHGVARIGHNLMTKPRPPPIFLPGKSMDRGAWWATVYEVTKSEIQLSHQAQNTHNKLGSLFLTKTHCTSIQSFALHRLIGE